MSAPKKLTKSQVRARAQQFANEERQAYCLFTWRGSKSVRQGPLDLMTEKAEKHPEEQYVIVEIVNPEELS